MNQIYTKNLLEHFPNLYSGKDLPPTENLMCFGFETGDGWYDLIWGLSDKIEELIVKLKKKESVWYKRLYKLVRLYFYWLRSYKLRLNKLVRELKSNFTWKEYRDISKPYWPKAVQVKEKFGGLRFYMNTSTKEIDDLITVAEGKSYEICEMCGKPGVNESRNKWVSTLCKTCEATRYPDRAKKIKKEEELKDVKENNELSKTAKSKDRKRTGSSRKSNRTTKR